MRFSYQSVRIVILLCALCAAVVWERSDFYAKSSGSDLKPNCAAGSAPNLTASELKYLVWIPPNLDSLVMEFCEDDKMVGRIVVLPDKVYFVGDRNRAAECFALAIDIYLKYHNWIPNVLNPHRRRRYKEEVPPYQYRERRS